MSSLGRPLFGKPWAWAVHHLLMDPEHGNATKFIQVLLTAFVSVPTLLTIFTITASLEIAGRLRGGRGAGVDRCLAVGTPDGARDRLQRHQRRQRGFVGAVIFPAVAFGFAGEVAGTPRFAAAKSAATREVLRAAGRRSFRRRAGDRPQALPRDRGRSRRQRVAGLAVRRMAAACGAAPRACREHAADSRAKASGSAYPRHRDDDRGSGAAHRARTASPPKAGGPQG